MLNNQQVKDSFLISQKVDHQDKKKLREKVRELKTNPGCPIAKYQKQGTEKTKVKKKNQ